MKKLGLMLLVVPALAFAKSYNSERTVTHDCAKDPDVSINVSAATFTIKGTCEKVSINGADNKVTVENSERISVNGADNTVAVNAVDRINVNGADNRVTYKRGIKKAKPRVKVLGTGSTVTRAK